jgi:hypothetical protein
LAARCWGQPLLQDDFFPQWTYAHTSPVYLRVEGKQPRADPASLAALVGQLDRMTQWVHREGCFENEHQRNRLAGVFGGARKVLLEGRNG